MGLKDEEDVSKAKKAKKDKIKKQQEEMRQQMMQGRMPQRPAQDPFADSTTVVVSLADWLIH